MVVLVRLYDGLIVMLARAAGIMIAFVFVLIVVDVLMRTAGMRPPAFSSAVSEYSLIYMTMFAAPWLVRQRGHVRIDGFIGSMPGGAQRGLERLLIVVCILLCAGATWMSAEYAWDFWQKNDIDIRSIEIPRTFLFVPLVIGFGLCGIEFLRFLLIGETLRAPQNRSTVEFEGEV